MPEKMHGHRFEAKHHKRLDSSYRRRILPPASTLKKFGLKKGMSVADIGAGSGYFLIPAARVAGREASVFGVDASKEMLGLLERKNLPSNIKLVHTPDGYKFKIDSGVVDYVIASAIIHENNPVRFLKEIRRIMKPGATLLIIDWRKESLRAGPPMHERLDPEEVKSFCSKSNLRATKSLILNSRYYAVLAKRD
jgi:ubiquinone/menaquinone biosynthesis C-methylase UbiE